MSESPGSRVRAAIDAAGLSIRATARRAGIAEGHLHKILGDKSGLTAEKASALASVLHVEAASLLGLEEHDGTKDPSAIIVSNPDELDALALFRVLARSRPTAAEAIVILAGLAARRPDIARLVVEVAGVVRKLAPDEEAEIAAEAESLRRSQGGRRKRGASKGAGKR